MAAKILQSLTDDNPDLQEQIGCMTGIFQIFDRQHVITPRRITGHRSNRHSTDSAYERESNSIYNKSMPMEKHSRRNVLEKQRVSTEPSRASFSSSSRSSSFSSLDLNNNVQQDSSSSLDRITFPENPPKHAGMNQSSVSPQLGRQSLDLREVVKESMYRESQTLSIKTTSMEEVVKKLFTSPWLVEEQPRELSRSASYHHVKEGSFFSIVNEGPRFSYDGKDTRHVLFDSRDNSKSSMKPPRLSLDSRESSTRSLMSETSGTQTRPSSVVAKLMGLEAMPSESKTSLVQDCNVVYTSSKTSELSKPIQISIPSKTLYKEPNSPRWKVPDSSVKPISRFPMEPAPWKQVDGNRISTKGSIKGMKAPVRNSSTFPTVFSEIEKRLKDLEFSQSGKDLRALKQILEAMQAKGLLENQNEENARKNSNSTTLGDSQKPQKDQVLKRGTNISRNHESPIVVVKSAKMIEKSGIPPSSVISIDEISNISRIQRGAFVDNRGFRGQTAKSSNRDRVPNDVKSINRTSRTTQASSSRTLQNAKDESSNSISPRLHKKKQELEKRSKPPIHPSESIKSRKPANKQVTDSSSPGGRRRPKNANIRKNDEPSSDYSAQSDGSILSESPMDIEVNCSVSCLFEKKSTLLQPENESQVKHPPVVPEYRSPISVLDAVLDIDDSPSPVRNKQKTIRGDKSREYESISCSDEHNPEASSLTDPAGFIPMSEINRKKLQKIENLVQKLQRLNSTHDEAQTDYIASLCENTNPDHRYISEILLASGFLLSDLESSLTNFHFHASGHPINPELFLVLEQTTANNFTSNERDLEKTAQLRSEQKVHRKLIFDTVNEVLGRKLAESGHSNKLARKNLNAQMLLRELCLETEELQTMISKCSSGDEDDVLRNTLYEDVMHHQSESWTNHRSDVSGIILDIERLVFKDLVNEIVIGEAPGLENKPVRRRQLFKN